MRVTNAMMMNRAIQDLDGLRQKLAKASGAVNGRVLERPSEDPIRVAEAMDLSGAKLRMERAQRSGQDARQWLSVTEMSLSTMIERFHSAREIALQADSPRSFNADSRESFARELLSLRDSLLRETNAQHRDQYLFAGWKTETQPFADDGEGGASYVAASNGEITRDIAPGLGLVVNVTGSQLMEKGDFLKTLSDMAEAFRTGNTAEIGGQLLSDLDEAMGHLTVIRSDLGTRQVQAEQYETYAGDALYAIEDRLTYITGADLAEAVMRMTEAQTSYQTALASFSKSLPSSLVDYMLR